MRKENLLGMWREHSGDPFPSVATSPRGHLMTSDMELVRSYLKDGAVWIASPGFVYSVAEPGAIAGTNSLRTDGKWAWHDAYLHYVEKFSVALPKEFFEDIRAAKGIPPIEEEVDVESMELPEL